ncbi:hypothetical protein P4H61_14995 [Paenibacillus peoriae]|uniref:hypothetical protein n=1 Tax=Paenibacillus peoriae TaxID=59893 RepID=UPI00026C6850|nr:hypothetical protein [Paenibacillus peoriae]MEC0182790.1 hypothetical protein [Paenibacillus peoriae]
MYLFIIFAEVLFWVFVVLGLIARYMFGKKKLGGLLLLCTPVIDILLLIAVFITVSSGMEITTATGLAACYLGITVAFGQRLIKWADVRFSYWFGKGPKPKPKYGAAHAKEERTVWLLHLLGWAIGNALLLAIIVYVGDPQRTASLDGLMRTWAVVLVIDFIVSFSYTLAPRKNKR